MKCRLVLVAITILLLPTLKISAQQSTSETSTPDASQIVAYWVAYWAKPKVILFGPPQEDFTTNVHEVLFPNNVYDAPENSNILDENAQWLKDHASDHFYIEGYASSKGAPAFNNLRLSAQRADWVKQALISKGVPENQIVSAAGWGYTYPVCAELDDDCWSKNRIVRFVYSPRQ
ncbi:MAG TPA: OmpA family protein [Edaphobacter sp.]|jgi:outer membrane protein OmpA-like peptidoglycan-associated protein